MKHYRKDGHQVTELTWDEAAAITLPLRIKKAAEGVAPMGSETDTERRLRALQERHQELLEQLGELDRDEQRGDDAEALERQNATLEAELRQRQDTTKSTQQLRNNQMTSISKAASMDALRTLHTLLAKAEAGGGAIRKRAEDVCADVEARYEAQGLSKREASVAATKDPIYRKAYAIAVEAQERQQRDAAGARAVGAFLG